LEVRKAAHAVVLDADRLTRSSPGDERCTLNAQMRRAAITVPANIAEGYGRRRPADKARYHEPGVE
jgi:four helix bundle protein